MDPAGPPADDRRPTVALALGAGGAKGLTHIGAIEELERQGYRIRAISGSSMGALIGGIYAMGQLPVYRDWVCSLARLDVLRMLDWTLSGGGLIKGEKLIGTLRGLIGDTRIEELPIDYTAVATDIGRGREVWLTRGFLFDAIRASIAIPTLFRPHAMDGMLLVDGALLNPVPVTPLMRVHADYTVAISVDGPPRKRTPEPDREARHGQGAGGLRQWLRGGRRADAARDPGALELLTQSLDLMQANLSRLRLAAYEPDLLIQMPRNVSMVYEFYRARELIELGRRQAREALERWQRGG